MVIPISDTSVSVMVIGTEKALDEAKSLGIHGKETTPFLLAKIKDITGGDSLDSNIQLVFNNARVASETAKEICRLDA